MLRKLCSSLSYSDGFDDTSGPHAAWDQTEADSLADFSEAATAAVVAMVGLAFEARIAAGPGVRAVGSRR